MLNVNDRLLFEVDESELFLLLHICVFWDGEGNPFPSIDTLAKRTGFGVKKVRQVKQSLIEKGLISAEGRYDAKGARTSDSITIETEMIGVYVSMKGKQFIDQSTPPLPKKGSTPLPFLGSTPPPQKGEGNTLTNIKSLTTEEVLSLARPMTAQKAAAVIFEHVGFLKLGLEFEYDWKARSGADFKALKTIREMIVAKIPEQERSNERVNQGLLWIFGAAIDYLSSIANSKGGSVCYDPLTVQRNFNQAFNYGKGISKAKLSSSGAARGDNDLADMLRNAGY